MRKTANYGLVLHDAEDKMSITPSENSLNATMEIIDKALKEKTTTKDMTDYIEEHKDELKGADGKDGADGVNGKDGTNGQDGYSPTARVETTSTGATITVTDKNGTTTATITNGKDGAKGDKGDKGDTGEQGIQGIQGEKGEAGAKGDKGDTGDTGSAGKDGVSVTHSWDGTTLNVTSASGTTAIELTKYNYCWEYTTIEMEGTTRTITSEEDLNSIASYLKKHLLNENITLIMVAGYKKIYPTQVTNATGKTLLYYPIKEKITSEESKDSLIKEYIVLTINYSGSGEDVSITSCEYKKETAIDNSYLDPNVDYATPYTPLYNGSPATKKYVDDTVSEYVKSVNGTLPDETGNVTVTVTAQQPEFVVKDTVEEALEWLRENGDTSKVYVLPNGYIYKYMTTEITYEKPNCNNLFVGDEAWLGYRISSANLVKAYTGRTLTNVIPVNPGETYDIRVYGLGGCEQIIELSDVPTLVEEQVPTNFIQKTAGLSKTWEEPKASTCKFTHTMSSTTKYIFLDTFATTEDELANGIVTLNESVVLGTTPVTEEVTDWTNTGQTYNSTDYEDRIIALEEDSVEYDSRLKALESDTSYIPDYWQTHLDEKVPLIRSTMASVGKNKSAFLFYSDAHWNGNTGNSPMLLKYLYKYTPINKVNFGGDIVSTESDDTTEMAYLYDSWRSAIRDLPNHHSVVGNHDDGNDVNGRFGEDYVYSYLLAPEETNDRVDGDGLYYYIDDKCEKTRYLYLDSAYYKHLWSLKVKQAEFIIESLLSVPENWHVVVISHCWFNQNYDNYPTVTADGLVMPTERFLALFSAYNNRTSGTLTDLVDETETVYSSMDYDFANGKGKVEFCIGGHLHNDYSETVNGIPIILCEADTMHNRNGSVSTAGTISEQAITAVIADYANSKINLIRIGRGSDREISY